MQRILQVFDNRHDALEFFKVQTDRYPDMPANRTTLTVWTGDNSLEQITTIEQHEDAYRLAGMEVSGAIFHGDIAKETREYIMTLVRNIAAD